MFKKNFNQRLIIYIAVFIILILFPLTISAENISLKGDNFEFDSSTGLATMTGNAGGQYGKYYFLADEIKNSIS